MVRRARGRRAGRDRRRSSWVPSSACWPSRCSGSTTSDRRSPGALPLVHAEPSLKMRRMTSAPDRQRTAAPQLHVAIVLSATEDECTVHADEAIPRRVVRRALPPAARRAGGPGEPRGDRGRTRRLRGHRVALVRRRCRGPGGTGRHALGAEPRDRRRPAERPAGRLPAGGRAYVSARSARRRLVAAGPGRRPCGDAAVDLDEVRDFFTSHDLGTASPDISLRTPRRSAGDLSEITSRIPWIRAGSAPSRPSGQESRSGTMSSLVPSAEASTAPSTGRNPECLRRPLSDRHQEDQAKPPRRRSPMASAPRSAPR